MIPRLKGVWIYWLDHPWVDIAVVGVTVLGMAIAWGRGWDPMQQLSQSDRASWAMTMAMVAAALLGFGIATVSILFAVTPGPRLAAVLRAVGTRLGQLIMATLRALAVATVGFILVALLDQASDPSAYWVVVFGLTVLAGLRLGRMLWLLARTITVLSLDVRGDNGEPVEDDWMPPTISESEYEIPKRDIV